MSRWELIVFEGLSYWARAERPAHRLPDGRVVAVTWPWDLPAAAAAAWNLGDERAGAQHAMVRVLKDPPSEVAEVVQLGPFDMAMTYTYSEPQLALMTEIAATGDVGMTVTGARQRSAGVLHQRRLIERAGESPRVRATPLGDLFIHRLRATGARP